MSEGPSLGTPIIYSGISQGNSYILYTESPKGIPIFIMNNQSLSIRIEDLTQLILPFVSDKLKFSWSREVNHHLFLGGEIVYMRFTLSKLIVGTPRGNPTVERLVRKTTTSVHPTGRPLDVAKIWKMAAPTGDDHFHA